MTNLKERLDDMQRRQAEALRYCQVAKALRGLKFGVRYSKDRTAEIIVLGEDGDKNFLPSVSPADPEVIAYLTAITSDINEKIGALLANGAQHWEKRAESALNGTAEAL